MTINYYPVVPIPYSPLPAGVTVYPGKPTNHPVPLKVGPRDLALFSRLSLFQTRARPLRLGWVRGMIESVTEIGVNGELCARAYDSVVPGWKGMFAQELGSAVSLAAAIRHERFKFFVPLKLCVNMKSNRFTGNRAWPNHIARCVPQKWKVTKLASAAYQKILMPDYVLMDWDANGQPRFSSLESKGRDKPIDTDTYAEYVGWKHQAQNAQLVCTKTGSQTGAPVFHRNVLSIVAVRPKLSTSSARQIQCRWFNNKSEEAIQVPASWAIELAAMHYILYLDRLRFPDLSMALSVAMAERRRIDLPDEDIGIFDRNRGIITTRYLRVASVYPCISAAALDLVKMLISHFTDGYPAADEVVGAIRKVSEQDLHEVLPDADARGVSILPSGLGLTRVR